MAHPTPRSFAEAFRPNYAELVEYIYVSSRLWNQLLDKDLLNVAHVEKLEVRRSYSFCYSFNSRLCLLLLLAVGNVLMRIAVVGD